MILFFCAAPPLAAPRLNLEGQVTEWAGSGPNAAFIVIDFDESTTQSAEFVFGVNFTSGTITGEEALNILATLPNLEITSTSFSFGLLIDAFTYVDEGTTHTALGGFPIGWNYWTSTDFGENWDYSMAGVSDRILTDGDTDGWMFGDFLVPIAPNGPRNVEPLFSAFAPFAQQYVGSGERTAFVVLDFSDAPAGSAQFVFGVQFDQPSITGFEMLDLLNTQSDVEITSTIFSFGAFIQAFSYTFNGVTYSAADAFPITWTYYTSRTGGQSWNASNVGVSDRVVHHGDADGWAFGAFGVTPPNGPIIAPPIMSGVRNWERYR